MVEATNQFDSDT